MPIAYDASREALFRPASRPTVFQQGDAQRLSIDAICSECSRLAYLMFESSAERRSALTEALSRIDAADFAGFDHGVTGTQAYAIALPATGHAMVVFRGTEPEQLTDLGTDLNLSVAEGPAGGLVHAGFAEAFSSIRAEVDAWLTRHPGFQIVFSGHSLGAALATLAAAQWPGSRLVTFGSSRVGNAAFTATIRVEAVARYVNCADIVESILPEIPLYTHFGEAHYIDRTGRLRPGITPREIEADKAAARVEYLRDHAWRTGAVVFRDLADHSLINHVRALFPADR